MLEFLEQALFADKLLEDKREPLTTFEIPGLEGTFGLFAPTIGVWQQLFYLVLIQMLLQVVFAAAVYRFVIRGRGSTQSFLFGFGVIIPLALYIPFFLLEELDVQNKPVRMSLTTLPCIVCFRTMEAMFKTPSDIVVEVTMENYMTYYTSLLSFEWSTKTLQRRKITTAELMAVVRSLTWGFVRMSLVLSYMMHVNYQPFESNVKLDEYNFTLDLFSPAHLANAYLLGVLTFSYLALGFDMTAFSDQAKGYYTKPIFLNPLLESRTLTEFWGQRWNLMIHRFLKHGIFRPAKKYFSTTVSVLWAFVFSGLFHDYVWAVVFYHSSKDECATCHDCDQCFHHKPGKVSAFFVYLGICMLLERPLAPYLGFMKSWPTPIVSTLVMLTGCPAAHWYIGDWVVGGKFTDFATAVFLVKKL